jgi:sugar lactone lactonase YvrE
MGSISRRLGTALVAACLLSGAMAAQASALLPYQMQDMVIPKTVFAPNGLAVDQENSDLYVAGTIGSAGLHGFDAETEVETAFGEGNYESVAVNPVDHNIYALTKPPFPIRIEIYNHEWEIDRKPIPTPAGHGRIGLDSAGNVFIPDIGAINEQQKFIVGATGGTYKLIFEGEETAPIEWNAEEFQVSEALAALANIGEGNVGVTRSGQTYTVTFQGALASTDVPQLSADSTGLSEGTVNHIETIVDGSNAPPSIKQYSEGGVLLQTITCGACPGGAFTAVPNGVAFDDEDNLYVDDAAGERVITFHATPGSPTNYSAVAPTEIDSGATRAMAVDPRTHQVFVIGDDGSGFHVKGFEPGEALFADFGLGVISSNFLFFGTLQVAVDSNTGSVYVGDVVFSETGIVTTLREFVPAPPPTIEPDTAGVEASRHATLKTLINPNGTLVLSCTFEYGTTEAYGSTLPCNDPGFGSQPVGISAEALGLQPDTVYHYRVTASSETGTTVGPDQQFKTLIDKAAATTGGAQALQTTASVEGAVNPGGHPLTECFFEYGADAAYGAKAPCTALPDSGSAPVEVSAAISGLQPNSTYHYRVVAVNAGGTEWGADMTLRTLPRAPAITTGAATLVGADTAKVAGTVNAEASVTRYFFEYGPSTSYGQSTAAGSAVGEEVIKVSERLSGLQPATVYHYRLVGQSVGGTTNGPDMTFTTGPRPFGRVFLPATAPLKQRKAAVELQCRGVAIAECKGTLVLRARIKKGIRFILVKVGEADFDFFGGQKKVVTVTLNAAGKKVISQSGGEPIPAVASAANKNRVVRLMQKGSR